MAVGYQGLVLLNDNQYPVTSGSITPRRNPLLSGASYVAGYGRVNASDPFKRPVGSVHLYDFESLTAELQFDVNNFLLDELFTNTDDNVSTDVCDIDQVASTLGNKINTGGWALNRHNPRRLRWYNNKELKYQSGKAFWTNLELRTAPAELVTCSLGLEIIPDHPSDLPAVPLQLGDDYIEQKFGITKDVDNLGPGNGYETDYFSPLTHGVHHDHRPVPFWSVILTFEPALPDEVQVSEWTVSLTNPLQRHFTCAGSTETDVHPGPTFLSVGVSELNVSFTLHVVRSPSPGTLVELPMTFDAVTLTCWANETPLKRRSLRVERVESQELGTPLVDVGDLQRYDYSSLGFFTPPRLV